MLLSAYRRDDYADPKGFVVQLGAVLEVYPEWVIRGVTDPLTGVQREQKFPPSIAEVVSACEELYGPVRYAADWNERARRQAEQADEDKLLKPGMRNSRGRLVTYQEAVAMGAKIHGAFEH